MAPFERDDNPVHHAMRDESRTELHRMTEMERADYPEEMHW